MLRRLLAHSNRALAAEKSQPWRQQFYANILFFNPTASYSSTSSRKSSSLHNYYLRKRRKWPIQSYKTQWTENFAIQLAKQSFKKSMKKSRTNLLSDLIRSFAAYEVAPSPQSYHFLFKILIQKQPPNWSHQVLQILHHIENVESFEPPEGIFIDLIKFYGDNNMLSDALDLFFRIPKFRCDPSVGILNALLSILCMNQSGIEMVPQILMKSGIRIEESSVGILIIALCKIDKFRDALNLLNCMVEEGLNVHQKACSFLLTKICGQVNGDNGEIMKNWDELKGLGFEPRRDDFRNLIWHLVKMGNSMEALKLLKQMKADGIKPDIECCNLVLEGLVFNREFLNVDKVFDEILILGLEPDICTYNVYINGLFVQNKTEEGISMLASMEDLGCPPELSTYSIIIKTSFEAGEMDRAKAMMNRMRQKGIRLDRVTYEMIIDSFISNGDMHGACSFVKGFEG